MVPPMTISMKRDSTVWRLSMGTRSPIEAMPRGMIAPPMAPDRKRAASMVSKVGATATAAIVAARPTNARRTIRVLPKRSPSGPNSNWNRP